jgi:hypothetical protein
MYKSPKLFVPRIPLHSETPLHSVNISECNGMCGTHTRTCRKIDICTNCTCHSQCGRGIHSDAQEEACRCTPRLRRVSKHATARALRRAWGTRGSLSRASAAAGRWWRRRRCCVPVLPCAVLPPAPSQHPAVPSCGRIWVQGRWWAAEARRAQRGVACLCYVIPCCAAAAALPPATV